MNEKIPINFEKIKKLSHGEIRTLETGEQLYLIPLKEFLTLNVSDIEKIKEEILPDTNDTKILNWRMKEVEKRQRYKIFTGCYRVKDPNSDQEIIISGRIIEYGENFPTEVYIFNPPPKIKSHPKWSCFQYFPINGEGCFKLHWSQPAYDFKTACLYVEKILSEAMNF